MYIAKLHYSQEEHAANFDTAIAVMKRVDKKHRSSFNMNFFIKNTTESVTAKLPDSEDEVKDCGTVACFAGWMVLSPEGKAAGFQYGTDCYGNKVVMPEFKPAGLKSPMTITSGMAEYLGITYEEADALIYPNSVPVKELRVYPRTKHFDNITPRDVINALRKLKRKYHGQESK